MTSTTWRMVRMQRQLKEEGGRDARQRMAPSSLPGRMSSGRRRGAEDDECLAPQTPSLLCLVYATGSRATRIKKNRRPSLLLRKRRWSERWRGRRQRAGRPPVLCPRRCPRARSLSNSTLCRVSAADDVARQDDPSQQPAPRLTATATATADSEEKSITIAASISNAARQRRSTIKLLLDMAFLHLSCHYRRCLLLRQLPHFHKVLRRCQAGFLYHRCPTSRSPSRTTIL